jgi:ATP-binding cassette subfamily F protein uup
LAGSAAAAPLRANGKPRGAPRAAQKKRMSFNDKHALEKLPGAIATIREELARLERRLADQRLHDRDPAGFMRATADYGAKQKELAAAEEQWLRLEMLREEIEG